MTNGLIEVAEVMLSASERRLEVVSRNVANLSTPGFKKETSLGDALSVGAANPAQPVTSVFTDFAQGSLRLTGNPLDLALSGVGLFKLRSGDSVYYTRSGQFERSHDGTVRTAQGFALQTSSGEDLVLSGMDFDVL